MQKAINALPQCQPEDRLTYVLVQHDIGFACRPPSGSNSLSDFPNRFLYFFNNSLFIMTTRPRNESAVNALRMIPTKWAVVILGFVIAYVVLQPRLNQWFDWSLPTVASMVGDEKPSVKITPKKNGTSRSSTKSESPTKPLTKPAPKPQVNLEEDDSDPLYGLLTEVDRNIYKSPAGLVYGPGSEQGHRLKHIAKHLVDKPDRPGSHGVFRGSMKAFLIAIDDAYTRAKKGAKGTTKKEDDGSVVYEVTFEKAIGFIGGETGGRKNHPATKKFRGVMRGNNVITGECTISVQGKQRRCIVVHNLRTICFTYCESFCQKAVHVLHS